MELYDCNLEEYIQGRKTVPPLLAWENAIQNGEAAFFICFIMRQIINGLKFIHDQDEVHRDFNPQNSTPLYMFFSRLIMAVLYSSKCELWKVADFGLTSGATTTQVRTIWWTGKTIVSRSRITTWAKINFQQEGRYLVQSFNMWPTHKICENFRVEIFEKFSFFNKKSHQNSEEWILLEKSLAL